MSVKLSTADIDRFVRDADEALVEGGPEMAERAVAKVAGKPASVPSGLDPANPFFTHDPPEPTGESKTAADADEFLYE